MQQTICSDNMIKEAKGCFACRCRGSSHQHNDMPCQDAVRTYMTVIGGKPVWILTAADGHGSSQYDLSEYGSALAVETMRRLLIDMYKQSSGRADLFRRLKNDFPTAVVKMWRENIGNDYRERFSEQPEGDFYKRYGSTALFALIAPEGIFLGQLGDGDIAVADRYSVEFPMPRHDELVGGQTYSLVSEEAWRYWHIRTCSVSQRSLVMLSTDGLANSYLNDGEFERFIRSLYENLQKFSFASLDMDKYLKKVSAEGSGDDISIAAAIIEPYDFDC